MFKYIIQILIVAFSMQLLFTSCSCTCSEEVTNIDQIVDQYKLGLSAMAPSELKTMMDSLEIFYLIDVRELTEYAYGYIPGGVLAFKMENTAFWDNEMIYPPMKTDKLIVYCKKGKRSVIAAHYLERLGYENVWYLDGGYKAWEMTYPLEYEENLDEGGC